MAKKWLIVLLAALLFLLAASYVWANVNAPAIQRWVIAGGGGRVSGGNVTLQGTTGQPLAYRASGGDSELCAGFWCAPAGEYTIYLPALMKQLVVCFAGPWEIEPNDTPAQANGPLCSGVNYNGDSDHNGSTMDSDYFYIEMPSSGTINVQATNFLTTKAQLLLYDQSLTLLDFVADQPSGQYTLAHNGGPGRYYIRLVATEGHDVGQGPYTLRVTFP